MGVPRLRALGWQPWMSQPTQPAQPTECRMARSEREFTAAESPVDG